MQYLVALIFFGGVALFAWKAIFPKPSIRIVVSPSGLVNHHGLSNRSERELGQFFSNDVDLNSNVTILGNRDQQGRLKFTFRGDLDQGTEQQIRNFLQTLSFPK